MFPAFLANNVLEQHEMGNGMVVLNIVCSELGTDQWVYLYWDPCV